ncbi:aminopeptidase N [Sphingomonas sp. SUN039]|uniref:aminopeptidase N n=1 Tax=Sphingomonas sp. SUN039 TaxID=2937787 RepID=UPI0021649A32|nr:aminopeptidase N [Sphingomonas sp. SUN039]UVO55401.1 aminopeptidase N [Sphingomonas sp. SUN039]
MLDVQTASLVAADTPHIVRREDYRPPDWLVPDIALDFDLGAAKTHVAATLTVTRNGNHDRPLVLDGDGLVPLSVRVDGQAVNDWRMDGGRLVVPLAGNAATVETEVEIAPEANTQLMGLYASGGLLCTQCEAEGFRRITFFPDRPDVLSRYAVRMVADKAAYPVLLANGDNVANGDAEDGKHWAEWRDPHPKPCYLFAMVAGDLSVNADSFTTISGRTVSLGIWVRAADVPKTAHAMAALKASMAWDEAVYGREYDLDIFNIVAVDDFNFGAMENKGLNIFNSRYILADPDTATDLDYDGVTGVVAHEYFHNWSGNRVTCRDWFQLSLKEGFTVFRDQSFSADQGSAAVKRIEDVRGLRASQFPEDSGPLAHPIRPESYMEIGNFYTATVYNKGAEVIRMMHTMLGAERFRRGTDLYFDRHDGQAATCEDFVRAMEDGGGIDLTGFRRWYEQAGTPKLTTSVRMDGETAVLSLEQSVPATPGQPVKAPMPLPLRLALFDRATGEHRGETLHVLEAAQEELRFDGWASRPVLSINRDFSAPVVVETDRTPADLAFLSAHDDDPFARYEAMQQLMLDTLVADISGNPADPTAVIDAVGATLGDPDLDPAFIGEAVLLPSEAFIGDQMLVVDPEAISAAREKLRIAVAKAHLPRWRALYEANGARAFEYSPQAKGARRIRNVALGSIAAADPVEGAKLAFAQFGAADNMTDRMGALMTLANGDAPERVAALDIFYNRYRGNALVIDKWFSTQALSTRTDTLAAVEELLRHPDFAYSNPNRFRALVGAFSVNQRAFHAIGGRGYAFLADQILALDPVNPQTAAKMVPPLGRWRRFDEARANMIRAALERIVAQPGVSKDVYEQASKSLV